MLKTRKSKLLTILGLVISLATIAIIIKVVDFQQVFQSLQKLSWEVIALMLLLYLVSMGFRTYRWHLLISQNCAIRPAIVFKALIYGFMLNQLLPAKIGEIARAEYLTRKKDQSRSFLLGTIVVERIFDMMIILLFLGIAVLFSDLIMSRMQSSWLSIVLVVSGIVIVFILIRNHHLLKRITSYLPKRVRDFSDKVLDNLSSSFFVFSTLLDVVKLFILTLVIWLLTCLTFFLIINDLEIHIPYYAYFFIVSAGTFGMVVPSTSANVGVYHIVAMGSLMLFMVPKEQALSFAIIAHALDFFSAIILGVSLFGYGRITKLKHDKTIREDIV